MSFDQPLSAPSDLSRKKMSHDIPGWFLGEVWDSLPALWTEGLGFQSDRGGKPETCVSRSFADLLISTEDASLFAGVWNSLLRQLQSSNPGLLEFPVLQWNLQSTGANENNLVIHLDELLPAHVPSVVFATIFVPSGQHRILIHESKRLSPGSVVAFRVELAAGAKCELVTGWKAMKQRKLIHAVIGVDAHLQWTELSNQDGEDNKTLSWAHMSLSGQGASADFASAVSARGKTRYQSCVTQSHLASRTSADSVIKVLAHGVSRSNLYGRVHMPKGLSHLKASQKLHGLLSERGARVQVAPQLWIATDQVECSHGASVAPLDEESVYYLSTRGIDPVEARKMLMDGFLDSLIARVPESLLSAVSMEWSS